MEDIIIIGGGICGCSLLYELSRYQLKTLLLEKENDIACGTTKANSAIVHAGYDPEPGTLMARVNVEGNKLIERLSNDLDVLYKKTGSLVVGFNDEDRKTIEKLFENGNKNGVPGLRIIEANELFDMEAQVSREAVCALYAPNAGIISPWELASAQAECAVQGGAKLELDCEVRAIQKEKDGFIVVTNKGNYQARYVVNAAGVNSDKISELIETKHFSIQPKSGEYYILDTTERNLVKMIIFPCPSKLGKGVLVAPTVHGNIIVGPDSKNWKRDDYATSREGLDAVRRNAVRTIPTVNLRASIRNFSGIRADAERNDFIIGESKEIEGFFNIAGIKSPGLSSAPAIAKEVSELLHKKGLEFRPNPAFIAKRSVKRFKYMNEEEKKRTIQENPLYGTIVCRCETVTEGEIVDALQRPIPPRSLDAVKRRCTPGMGRCQSGFCGPRVLELIQKYSHVKPEDIPKDRKGMYIISGETKTKNNTAQGVVK
ncbi:MAG: NAD(P)/FAD-dependent oxidoreductase [Spirochaetaceae bacterium]|jgi:glycerol-3-phosphate dehydrogenase|nr:NAD(P)/FAD-dependent oxidoreductase [Spirochaetaceae bacterium]